ncbi:hypothetical protein AAFN86_20870 [Roseomonas sp. CAU 1739]|uniref:hypothetical protein n=1 Tax=Roseomonas sp. CAU 1739 TaxID=3140364 RepID=UPI00325BCB11
MTDTDPTKPRGAAGIFITKGMTIAIPPGGLKIVEGADGTVSTTLTLHLAMDMSLHWLRIALDHARACEIASDELRAIWKDGTSAVEIAALEAGFRAGMQACSAAAFTIDAFYATTKHYAPIPPDVVDVWRRNRTARAVQIAETLRLAFAISEPKFHELRDALDGLFMLRGEAVHPTGHPQQAVHHPILALAVERRLGIFNAENARRAANNALAIMADLTSRPRAKGEQFRAYCERTKAEIAPLVEEWLPGQRIDGPST